MTQALYPPSIDALRAVAALPASQHDRAISTFIGERSAFFATVAERYARRHGLDRQHVDEMHSIVLETALILVRQLVVEPAQLDDIRNFEGLVFIKCAEAARKYANSEMGHAPASGMSGVYRRRAAAAKVSSELHSSLGRAPKNSEVVTETNRRLMLTRSNAKTQNALVRESDLAFQPAHGLDIVPDHTENSTDFLLHPMEGSAIIARVIAHARAEGDDVLGDVATIWLGNLAVHNDVWKATDIAQELGVPPGIVRRHIATLKVVAANILHEEYNISRDDYLASAVNDNDDH